MFYLRPTRQQKADIIFSANRYLLHKAPPKGFVILRHYIWQLLQLKDEPLKFSVADSFGSDLDGDMVMLCLGNTICIFY